MMQGDDDPPKPQTTSKEREQWLNEKLPIAEWEKFSEETRRNQILEAWSGTYISLSAAVYWIATGGEPREPSWEEGVKAAKELLEATRDSAQKQSVTIKGLRRRGSPNFEAVPVEQLSLAFPFFGELTGFEEDAHENNALFLYWNSMLESERDDHIQNRTGDEFWSGLVVERAAVQRRWPYRRIEVTDKRRVGAPRDVFDRLLPTVEADIRAGQNLRAEKQEALAAKYGVSRGTIVKIVNAAYANIAKETIADNS